MKRIALLLALLCLAAPSVAQQNLGQTVQTLPGQRSADPSSSSTIAVTNTFQTVFTANTSRTGCTIQNNGSNTMWVYFVPIAGTAATKGASAILSAGQSLTCQVFGMNLTNLVQITGTAADAFYAASW